MERAGRFTTILRHWVILFVLVALLIIVAGVAYYRYERSHIWAERYQELAAIAELKVGQILRWRQEQLANARRLASSPLMRRAVAVWLQDLDVLGLQEDLEERFRLDQEAGAYADVLLLDTEGQTLISLLTEPIPLDPAGKRALEEALASGRATLSDFYRCPLGHIHLDTMAPILDAQGRPLAVVVLRNNAEDLLYPLIQSWPTPSRSAETLLVRVEGEEVLYLNDLRHQPEAALSLRLSLSRTDLPAVQAALGKQGMFEGKDYRGVKVLADLRPIPGSPWLMVAKVDEAEILSEARYRAGVAGFFILLFILLAAVTTTAGYRRRQVVLYRELYQAEREQRQAQEEFRTTLYSIGDAVITTDAASQVKQMNPEAERLTGWPEAEAKGKSLDEVFHILNEETRAPVESPVQRVLREGTVVGLANHSLLITRDGTEHPIADSGAPIRDEAGAISGVVLVFRDQTEERAAQNALRALSVRQEAILAAVPDIIMEVDANKVYTWANRAGYEFFGEDVLGKEAAYYFEGEQDTYGAVRPLFNGGEEVIYVESWQRRKDGQKRLLAWWCRVLKDERGNVTGALSTARDITEHQRAEEERQKLEAQLRQAQKMEAVGRLAGGVAHDFNNMLGVILGYTDIALSRLNPADPLYEDLQEVAGAARRSADLTRQLLAFSRRQTIAPKVLDLNVQLRGMERLLRRIVGEDIALEFALLPELWPVRLDPSQVDQVVANLTVNSRDAMPDGGRLVVETSNMTFDEAYREAHPWVQAGDYVLLAVSDTGCGMDKETLEHVFEPFFTTKAEGEGTGLGLATVYGIVKQNNGSVNIYSEPGQGTTVKLYFPRYLGEEKAQPEATPQLAPERGRETILLVEDEEQLRRLTRTLLERLGYQVLEAASPTEALVLCKKHQGEIHLLLTDVVMPAMSGKELAEKLEATKPDLKTLFMSGYTADAIAHRGVLKEGIHFLPKPFSLDALAKKVREALEG